MSIYVPSHHGVGINVASVCGTLRKMDVVAFGGLLLVQGIVKPFVITSDFDHLSFLPNLIWKDDDVNFITSDDFQVVQTKGLYTIDIVDQTIMMIALANYANMGLQDLIKLIFKKANPALVAIARSQNLFTIEGCYTEITRNSKMPYFSDGRDDICAWTMTLPLNPTSDELASLIKHHFITINCFITVCGERRVCFFKSGYHLCEDYSPYVSHVIDPNESRVYTGDKEAILSGPFCGVQFMVNIPLPLQIEACAKVMGVSCEEAYHKIESKTSVKSY
jgi:hypothetical protein